MTPLIKVEGDTSQDRAELPDLAALCKPPAPLRY